jgi:endoglucanase
VSRALAFALTIVCVLLAPAAIASAQQPMGPPPDPKLGPAPDLAPVPGQDPTPSVIRDCKPAGKPQGVPQFVDPRGVDPASANPLVGQRWFVDPTEPQWVAYSRFKRQGRDNEAALMWKTAGAPRFRWFGRFTRPRMKKKVNEYLNCVSALQPGAIPLMTVLRAQAKQCNKHYTGGGRAEDARTRKWYRDFAAAIGNARVVIAFEPDSLGTLECQKKSRRMARLKLLRYGVDVFSKQMPNATIYLEGGASDWEPAKKTAWQLRYIGIRKVRGFMLNVTHYDWTGENIKHGVAISRMTGGKHFIISTAFNGRGPVHVRKWISRSRHIWRTQNVWCHPLKRGLGPAPTTLTARPDKVDAYMYIGRPGYSGGSCNGGPLPIGSFWNERALMFGAYATNWVNPPRGTKNGHFTHYSPRALGFCGDRCT